MSPQRLPPSRRGEYLFCQPEEEPKKLITLSITSCLSQISAPGTQQSIASALLATNHHSAFRIEETWLIPHVSNP